MRLTRRGVALMDLLTGLAIAGMVGAAIFLVMRMERGRQSGESGRSYERKVKALAKIDPALMLYKEATDRRLKLDMTKPLGLAIGPGNRRYVVGDKRLAAYEADGRRSLDVKLDEAPRCVTVDPQGAILVGFLKSVAIFSPTGKRQGGWKIAGKRTHLTALAVTKDRVFAADAGNRVVHVTDRAGKPIRRLGEGHFNIPSPYFDLALGPEDTLDVVNSGAHQIETWRDTRRTGAWGRFGHDIGGFCGCCNPVSFARLPGGGYVTAEKGLTRIKLFDATGKLVGVVAGPASFPAHDVKICETPEECSEGGLDLAVDSEGRVLVLDPYARDVRVFVRKAGSKEQGQ